MICNDFEEDSIRMRFFFDDDFDVTEKAADSLLIKRLNTFQDDNEAYFLIQSFDHSVHRL